MNSNKSLFLRQSYLDAWEDYQRSLRSARFIVWDHVVLTASNEEQAAAYRTQIEMRQSKGLLPSRTRFSVLADPNGARVGSGGATLNVLRHVAELDGSASFAGKRILVVHSGGDSKRVPQYSACGKLFSPVPRELPNGKRSTLFDEFVIGTSGVPGRIKEGMFLLSGDVLLLFNPLQIDVSGEDAAAISFKEAVETGKNHGVYTIDENGDVGEFLHKQSVETLRAKGAANEKGLVDIDTGAVLLSAPLLDSLYGLISTDGQSDGEKFAAFVNDKARLSLYGDFLFPLASQSTREQYFLEAPEGAFCEELHACRAALWDALRPFRMKLLRLAPAAFIHFGTTRELLRLLTQEIGGYAFLDWSAQVSSNIQDAPFAANNAVVEPGAQIAAGSYLEYSYVDDGASVGANSVLSYATLRGQALPENVVLHGLKLRCGRFVARVYGVEDDPKGKLDENAAFLGGALRSLMDKNGLAPEDLWEDGDRSLWTAKLFPACGSMEEAVEAALNVCALARGQGDVPAWKASDRKSLKSGFHEADTQAILGWETRMRKQVKLERLIQCIEARKSCEDAKKIFAGAKLDEEQIAWLEAKANTRELALRMRIYYYMGKILGGVEGDGYMDRCFASVRDGILQGALNDLAADETCRIQKDDVFVQLPLRVNWGGGWSDTPPYCNEMGGTVLNAAISLKGRLPVEVRVKRLDECKVLLESADVGSRGSFSEIAALQNCSDPYDPFALHKAALLACGVIPARGGSLDAILRRMGGGVHLSTQVVGVPKGSGLGTSSILAGACVKALFEFLGKACPDQEVYDRVLCMEQIMSTGGGWQDQVGGVTDGVKFIRSEPGLKQSLRVESVRVPEEALRELDERFALIYTGQRRLARNLLRDVMGHYVGYEAEALEVLDEIQKLAALMRFELERGNVDAFAELLGQHWELSKRLDQGSTNTCIDQIFLTIEDLIDGKMICGAGGGGFLQVVLKKGVSKDALQRRLDQVFQDSGVEVWGCGVL